MLKSDILKREERIARRKNSAEKGDCPNCNIKLREKWHGGGSYCPSCNWEK